MVGLLIGVFESSGRITEGLRHLLKFFEEELQLRNEQLKMIYYPIVIGILFLTARVRDTDFRDSHV